MGPEDDLLFDVNRRVRPEGQGDRVRGPGIDDQVLVVPPAADDGVERVVPDVADRDPFHGDRTTGTEGWSERSWVIGRGVVMFSILRAMALASKTPIQMGRMRSVSGSWRTTIGILEMGSIDEPLDPHFYRHRIRLRTENIKAAGPYVKKPVRTALPFLHGNTSFSGGFPLLMEIFPD